MTLSTLMFMIVIGRLYTLCPPKKTCDYIFASLCVIERWFHFPPHLSSATTLPWEITEHKNDHLLMTHRLATYYAKNYCNRTPVVKVIVENVVTCFFWDTVYITPVTCIWSLMCCLNTSVYSLLLFIASTVFFCIGLCLYICVCVCV